MNQFISEPNKLTLLHFKTWVSLLSRKTQCGLHSETANGLSRESREDTKGRKEVNQRGSKPKKGSEPERKSMKEGDGFSRLVLTNRIARFPSSPNE